MPDSPRHVFKFLMGQELNNWTDLKFWQKTGDANGAQSSRKLANQWMDKWQDSLLPKRKSSLLYPACACIRASNRSTYEHTADTEAWNWNGDPCAEMWFVSMDRELLSTSTTFTGWKRGAQPGTDVLCITSWDLHQDNTSGVIKSLRKLYWRDPTICTRHTEPITSTQVSYILTPMHLTCKLKVILQLVIL